LAEHPKVEEVFYLGLPTDPCHDIARRLFERPLFGGLLSFKIKGSYDDVLSFMRRLKIIRRSPSLGGTESLIVIPSKSASQFIKSEHRQKLGITDNLVRLSVGLEDVNDIINDLAQALNY
jgi:cystathionine gamma-synthase